MLRFLIERLLSLVFVLVAVSIIVFVIMHAVPGGPFDEDKGRLPPAAKENIMRKYGLDKPMHVQYFNYMKNALRFDFGIPYQQPTTTVAALIGKTWFITMQVGILTIIVAFGLGITLGMLAARYQNTWIDNVVTFGSTLGVTVPNFVVAMWLILGLTVARQWLPMGGWSGNNSTCLIGNYFCSDWILPVVAYAIAPLAVIARYTRSSIVDVKRADYVRTAKAKGLSDRVVMNKHIFRNAQIPMVTVLGTEIPNLITGSIFIESIFRINGLGKFFVSSVLTRDYPMIMAMFLLIALLWGITYLLTDLAYAWIDPRIKVGAKSA
jgi:ABC-type dipeptide/oligopeptide/nickel transport system permease component